MNNASIRNLMMGAAMILSAWAGFALIPTKHLAEFRPKVNLESMIPEQFSDWHVDKTITPIQVSPDVQKQLDQIYSQVLSKTYVNSNGRRIMLSISYGSNQGGDGLQVHRPEYCYVGQGFELHDVFEDVMTIPTGRIAVRRLVASNGPRVEPITYWITIGDKATLPGFWRKLEQLKYGLTGKIPDGMLVRVSSISNNGRDEYRLHDAFVNELLNAITNTEKIQLIGKLQ